MFLEDILPKMSKLYLGRIVDSFLKDVHMESEEEMRAVILKNIDEFQNKERVKKVLNFHDETRDISLLNEMVLMSLRSEEHTSELQSRGHLVCRLLLEKKK